MNRHINLMLQIVAVAILFSCSDKKDDIKILVNLPKEAFSEIKISLINAFTLEQIPLAETKLDSLGNGSLNFSIVKPTFANLIVGQSMNTIYLEPNYSQVSISENAYGLIHYLGDGSEVNNYISQEAIIQSKIEHANGNHIFEIDEVKFLDRIDSLENEIVVFHKHYTDSVPLSKTLSELMWRRNEITVRGIKQIYMWNYGAQHDSEIPPTLKSFNEIPFDSSLMDMGLQQYADMLHMYTHLKFFIPIGIKKTAEEYMEQVDEFPVQIERQIIEGTWPESFKELFMAKNINYWMIMSGIEQGVDTIYNNFKKRYPLSSYLPPITSMYDKWLALSPGKPAPDFKGLTLDGSWDSLSNLKGKVIYVDVWATWCAPCRKDLPHSKELQKKFEGNDKLVFLYISVDRDKDAWKKMVLGDPGFKGVHFLQVEEKGKTLWDLYQVSGIPRYMLIDEKGFIVDVDAPRPSSPEIESQIAKLLTAL